LERGANRLHDGRSVVDDLFVGKAMERPPEIDDHRRALVVGCALCFCRMRSVSVDFKSKMQGRVCGIEKRPPTVWKLEFVLAFGSRKSSLFEQSQEAALNELRWRSRTTPVEDDCHRADSSTATTPNLRVSFRHGAGRGEPVTLSTVKSFLDPWPSKYRAEVDKCARRRRHGNRTDLRHVVGHEIE
jgi:hypothetical protein